MPGLFDPFTLKSVTLRNRIGVSPMCQYSAGPDGKPNDWHLVHLGSRAVGGAGLIILEATAVEQVGALTYSDLGLWSDDHVAPLARIVDFLEAHGAVPGIQIAHGGRKASTTVPWQGGRHGNEGVALPHQEEPGSQPWETIAPSAVGFGGSRFRDVAPREMTLEDITRAQNAFADAARRAAQAGFKWLEIHGANGYLISEFHSPLTNKRTDDYGGSFDNRIRFTLELTRKVRAVWPDGLPLTMRVNSSDWAEGGWTLDDTVALAKRLKAEGVDLLDCISGRVVREEQVDYGTGFQVPFAERVRGEAGIATAANGAITEPTHADAIVRNGRADIVLLGREMLREPYWPMKAAKALGAELNFPDPYRHWL